MSFPHLSRRIATLYTLFGLLSIPLLTLVTTVSVANVFLHGQLANGLFIEWAWAIIFSAAIEVNVFRLFFEAKSERSQNAVPLAIGLMIVAGFCLFIEGVQQSIGFDWSSFGAHLCIIAIIGLRVAVVLFLIAREGSRLGLLYAPGEQPLYACLVSFSEPEPRKPLEPESVNTSVNTVVNRGENTLGNTSGNVLAFPVSQETPAEQRIHTVLSGNPAASISEIVKQAQVSRGYASKIRAQRQHLAQ